MKRCGTCKWCEGHPIDLGYIGNCEWTPKPNTVPTWIEMELGYPVRENDFPDCPCHKPKTKKGSAK